MPAINLRLTDEQHAELVAGSRASGTSLQRHIISLLFTAKAVEPPRQIVVPATTPEVVPPPPKASTIVPPRSGAIAPQPSTMVPPVAQHTFKGPDLKPESTKKPKRR